jgi:hypothetical protein
MIPVGTKVSFLVSGVRRTGRVLAYVDAKLVLVQQDGAPTTQRGVTEAALTVVDPPTPPTPAPLKWPTHGISPGYKLLTRTDAEHAWELDQVRDVGAQFVRVDSTPQNQAQVDRTVAGVRARAMEPLLILHGSAGPMTPATAAAFTTTQATKWKGRVRLYEFCNEPDMHDWTPEGYAAAAKAAFLALKKVDPDALLAVGALWKTKQDQPRYTLEWVQRMYVAGVAGHLDALSLHLYNDPMTRGDWNLWDYTFHTTPCIRSVMDQNGDSRIPIVSTENGEAVNKHGETQQALVVANDFKALQVYAAKKFVMHTVFSMTDDDSADDFGLTRPDRARRPAWQAYRTGAGGTFPGATTFPGAA